MHPLRPLHRRHWLAWAAQLGVGAAALPTPAWPAAGDSDGFWVRARQGGHLLLMRHARTEAGLGDPPGFRLDDCRSQRNLSDAGRDDARRLGQHLVQEGVRLDAVYSSAWCRCTETAALAFDPHHPPHRVWPALNSFFQGQGDGARQTREVLQRARQLQAPANWMLVTHQVNITALTGAHPAMGEVFLTRPHPREAALEVLARWRA